MLSLFAGYDGPATMGLNLKSLESGISMYSDFCVSTSFLLPQTCEFWVVRKTC